jgi:hypothetical protein
MPRGYCLNFGDRMHFGVWIYTDLVRRSSEPRLCTRIFYCIQIEICNRILLPIELSQPQSHGHPSWWTVVRRSRRLQYGGRGDQIRCFINHKFDGGPPQEQLILGLFQDQRQTEYSCVVHSSRIDGYALNNSGGCNLRWRWGELVFQVTKI